MQQFVFENSMYLYEDIFWLVTLLSVHPYL